ncbi:hypothetical protein L9Z41_08690 [Leptospira noguchii]|uniref:hypothetical protein n=1 Tax=Leptospira noguchii TaxID=28182 RepID=UPI001F06DA51|nr:hypothetical protein [Leptospira noguchii]MCH1912052.1 hypothetical protein [Leptospira noguchii]MCH1915710.1 hypothetical protein [Leptospira noguchii]UOG63171.1 hypothetical protein MAL04_12575 [Leptospira noguchii]
MKKSTLYIFLFSGFVFTNLIWYYHYAGMEMKNDYHITESCEYSNLLKLKEDFPKGMTISEFTKKCNRNNSLECTKSSSSKKKNIVYNVSVIPNCPESGRPDCGFYFSFRNERLVKVEAGYPCH